MSWASRRKTTREEDIAYCLLGLFDVNMPLLYVEGRRRAFERLQEEILKRSTDQSCLAWICFRDMPQSCLSHHPADFSLCGNVLQSKKNARSFTIDSEGIQIRLPLRAFSPSRHLFYAFLDCTDGYSSTSSIAIPLRSINREETHFIRLHGPRLELTLSKSDRMVLKSICILRRPPIRKMPVIQLPPGPCFASFPSDLVDEGLEKPPTVPFSSHDRFAVIHTIPQTLGEPLYYVVLVEILDAENYSTSVAVIPLPEFDKELVYTHLRERVKATHTTTRQSVKLSKTLPGEIVASTLWSYDGIAECEVLSLSVEVIADSQRQWKLNLQRGIFKLVTLHTFFSPRFWEPILEHLAGNWPMLQLLLAYFVFDTLFLVSLSLVPTNIIGSMVIMKILADVMLLNGSDSHLLLQLFTYVVHEAIMFNFLKNLNNMLKFLTTTTAIICIFILCGLLICCYIWIYEVYYLHGQTPKYIQRYNIWKSDEDTKALLRKAYERESSPPRLPRFR
jgi:hypothetical protein